MKLYQKLTLIILRFSGNATVYAQLVQATIHKAGARYNRSINEETPIINAATGQRMSVDEYSQLIKAEPSAWHLVPDYNKYV